ncbi:threonine/serine exporter family protein [Carnobacteriaceae bacterium zg-ZUI252]|nr:threonine/serine exporter family protein [Carnobacteriaceae bacterium zg-ZUI252]MBS4769910.1 threonine/serine exporter family protein [Carnobacteriaceae bacterium zg-ZUI240]QTU83319.1 threonine/serine exporter family protein [Carnobacteriaceae bacterium zg-C25]
MITNIWVAIITSFVATYAGAITLDAPRHFLLPSGLGGAICWVVYSIVLEYSNNSIASFVSSLAVAVLSNIFARRYKSPVTMFFIPSFLPIVPGVGVYRTVYFYISNNPHHGYQNLVATLETSIAIAIAIIIVDSSFKLVYKFKKSKQTAN